MMADAKQTLPPRYGRSSSTSGMNSNKFAQAETRKDSSYVWHRDGKDFRRWLGKRSPLYKYALRVHCTKAHKQSLKNRPKP